MSLCMHPRCHLMREHDPDECGWPAEKPVPNLMKALRESLEKAVQPPATPTMRDKPSPELMRALETLGKRPVQPPATPQEPAPSIDCPLCGEEVRQVSSATLSLALSQHVRWVCRLSSTPSPEGQTWQVVEPIRKKHVRDLLATRGARAAEKREHACSSLTIADVDVLLRALPSPPTPEGTQP